MKVPQILTYALLILCCNLSFSQKTSLSTLPSGIYLNKEVLSISATLESESYKTLFAAVKAADLEEVLGMSGPFTFFAPSNSAFSQFTSEELNELFKEENKKKLKDLLTYHIVAGNLTASKILRAMCKGEGKASFTTVQGNKIMATMQGTDIILADTQGNTAKITVADVGQSNGVIHEIDSVISPTKI